MGGGDESRYVGVIIGLGWVIAAWRLSRRLFTLILVVILLPDYLVSWVFYFALSKK